VEMWNDNCQEKVVGWIRRNVDANVSEDLVQITPFEEVILNFKSAQSFNENYTLSPVWTKYHSYKTVQMKVFCSAQIACDNLAKKMQKEPKNIIDELNLLLSIPSQTSQTKQTEISVESLRSTRMMVKLEQQMGTNDIAAFLTANDEQQFLSESATNVLVTSFDDSGKDTVFSEESKEKILSFLKKNLLDPSRTIIKDIGDENWKSVYWNPDNYRPDVTTKTLNTVYNKLNTEDKSKMLNQFNSLTKIDIKADVNVPLVAGVKGELDIELSRSGKDTKEDVNKFLQETKNNVEWNGIKFEPKPMSLRKLNLAKLRDEQTFKDSSVKVSYGTAVLTIGLQTVSQEIIKQDLISPDTGIAELKRRIESKSCIYDLCIIQFIIILCRLLLLIVNYFFCDLRLY